MKNNMFRYIVFIFTVLFILFSRFFPVYYAYQNTPEGYVYVGQTSSYDPWDINVYVAAIRYGQHGNITLKNQYTTLEDREAIIYPLYTVAGNMFKYVDPYILYHALAVLVIILLCVIIFVLSYKILQNYWYSLISMFLVLRGGGFGWLSIKLFGDKIPSADLFYSNITFTSALQKPHDGIGTLLLILSIILFYFFVSEKRNRYAILSFLSLLVLMFFYPYYIVSYGLIAGLYSLNIAYRKKSYQPLAYFLGTISVCGMITIFLYINIIQSGFAMVTGEVIDKVSMLSFIFGYGVFIIFFIFASLNTKIPNNIRIWKFLLLWIAIDVACSYLPIGYSRFYLRGLFFPLVLLMLLWIKEYHSRAVRVSILIAICFLMPLTSLFVFFDRIQKSNMKDPWQYMLIETNELFEVLKTKKRDGVLSSFRLGNFAPAKTNKSVYIGHLFQTPDAQERMNNVFDYYSGNMTEDEAKDFLVRNKLSFVIYGRDEQKLGGHVYSFLKLHYKGDIVRLYSL